MAGEPRWVDKCGTFAGGIATNYPGGSTFPHFKDCVDLVTLVNEDALIPAALTMLRATGHFAEGAGAAALVGVLADPTRYAGRKVVVLLSGSNAEAVILERLNL